LRIALDATYSLGDELSGVGVYSREILEELARLHPEQGFDWFYRSQRYFRARGLPKPENARRRLLTESLGSRSAALFHGLNQRLPARRFKRQIATFHDLFVLSGEYSTPEFRERFAAQARQAAAGADLIIAVSAFTAGQVEHYLGFPASRIRVIHHGVLPRAIPEIFREKMVLCVGAIQKRKNQSRLIRAFRAMPHDWRLVLAGSQGFDAEEAIREAQRDDRVRITGYVTDEQLGKLYARASIFAFPSLDEGFGIPVLEAMAAGIPVIASNRSALPEVCGGAAELVNPDDEEALSAALMRLETDSVVRDELIRRGLARAGEFRWETAVAKTWAVYGELT
jgi:glycosyltransferase involved in cell wall biosynthesis